jgi:hypothetical protein
MTLRLVCAGLILTAAVLSAGCGCSHHCRPASPCPPAVSSYPPAPCPAPCGQPPAAQTFSAAPPVTYGYGK